MANRSHVYRMIEICLEEIAVYEQVITRNANNPKIIAEYNTYIITIRKRVEDLITIVTGDDQR